MTNPNPYRREHHYVRSAIIAAGAALVLVPPVGMAVVDYFARYLWLLLGGGLAVVAIVVGVLLLRKYVTLGYFPNERTPDAHRNV